jgi:hypothetical protein
MVNITRFKQQTVIDSFIMSKIVGSFIDQFYSEEIERYFGTDESDLLKKIAVN